MTGQDFLRRSDGYTLVELLVVLILVGLIATAMSAGMQMGTRVWESSETGIARSQSAASAQAVLRNSLASALPRAEDGLVRFHGEPDFVAFDMPPPRAFGGAGLVRTEISLARSAGGTVLKLRMTSLIDGKKTREAVLADRLGGLRLAYLDSSGTVPVWLDFWRDRPRLPDAVRLSGDAPAGSAPWPAFVARLPVSQPGLCEFDPVSTSCRKP